MIHKKPLLQLMPSVTVLCRRRKKHSHRVHQFHSSSHEANYKYSLTIFHQMLQLFYCSTFDFFRFHNQLIHLYFRMFPNKRVFRNMKDNFWEAVHEQSKWWKSFPVCTALITKQAVVLKKGFPKRGVKAKGGALCITKYNKWEIWHWKDESW